MFKPLSDLATRAATSLIHCEMPLSLERGFEETSEKTCGQTTSPHACVPAQKGAEGQAEPLRSLWCSRTLQKPHNPSRGQVITMTLRQRHPFKESKPTKEPRAPGICTGRIFLVKQVKL